MGLLLKEALKCLCGMNRWSYAVFWKIGHRNPTLLVWEAHHYEPASEISGFDRTEVLLKKFGVQAEDRVSILINKMMINNEVHVLGEGMVGRAAFTGDHQWILQQNMRNGYLSEVLMEVHHQFLAGMQTVVVIPVLPHGVVQLGSTLMIAESIGFVNEVKSLFTQLGGVSDTLLSDCYAEEGFNQKIGTFSSVGIPISVGSVQNSHHQMARFNCKQEISTSQLSGLVSRPHSLLTQPQNCNQANSALQTTPLSASTANTVSNHVQANAHQVAKPILHLEGNVESGAVGAQVILSRLDAQSNQWAYPNNPSSSLNHHLIQQGSSGTNLTLMEQQNLFDAGLRESANSSLPDLNNAGTSQVRPYGDVIPNSVNDSVIASLLSRSESPEGGNGLLKGLQYSSSDTGLMPVSYRSLANNNYVLSGIPCQTHSSTSDILVRDKLNDGQLIKSGLHQALNVPPVHQNEHISRCGGHIPDSRRNCSATILKHDKESPGFQNFVLEDACVHHSSGDDLFDVLGLDSKRKQLYGSWNSVFIHGADADAKNVNVDASASITQMDGALDFSAANDGISESGIFSETADHLLDAVVSKVHSRARHESEDNMSWTTLTKVSSTSVLTDAPTGGQLNTLDQKQGKLFGRPPPLVKTQIAGSSSFKSGCSKENTGECSQVNSTYTSQISLLSDDFQNCKRDNSVSTAHSKRPDETGKSNPKRLRPGENPRPRPKDRQMIQDRLTELREIVPNVAKCSIDVLLERTIKHMLFLQSVTKHADKLKDTGESKIISKDGGGALWAVEVGPQSMVCPIIVEDLNPPRQMLVEMLCEERGFFLEIADIIRQLGLTILKGVMEARNEKVWVRFTVEANRDVTRMEIFLSLVHLLEQTMKSSAAESKGTDGGTVMAENPFHQAFIPATGPSDTLH